MDVLNRYRSGLLLAGLLVGLVASCDGLSDGAATQTTPRTLEDALDRWHNQDITAYRFRFARSCFCAPSHLSATVAVRGDTVFAVESVRANGTPIEETDHRFDLNTTQSIEQLFDLISAAERGTIDSVSVTYDDQLGFPSELFVDPLRAMADEEITYYASDVERIDSAGD